MSAGAAVHHRLLGIGQILTVQGQQAIVRFVRGTFTVPTNTLGRVHAS